MPLRGEKKRDYDRKWRKRHRAAIRTRDRSWYSTLSPTQKLERSLRIQCKQYGITVADYRAMEKRQRGRCAVCRELPGKTRLDIDHDHTTGRVRGLLCRRCNLAVGFWERGGLALIRQLTRYIEKDPRVE